MKTKAFQPNLEGKGPRDKHLFGGLAAQSVASASSPGAPSHGFLDTLDFHSSMEGNCHAGSGTPATQAREEPCRGASCPGCDPVERMTDTALR